MKVIVLRSNDGNPDPRIEKTIRALNSSGHHVTFLGWNRLKPHESSFLDLGDFRIPTIILNKKSMFGGGIKNLLRLAQFQLFIIRKLYKTRHQYDAIHAADFDTALAASFINIFLKKKFVYDIFDYYADAFPVPSALLHAIRFLDTKIINTSDALILTSESRRKQIGKANPKQIIYIHNTPPVQKRTDQPPVSTPEHILQIAYVGILKPDRLILETIRAVIKHSSWKIQIAGFGPLEEEIIAYSKNYKNIIFHGKVDYKTSLRINSEADILVATYNPTVPNHRYSTPNKLYEAMHLAKPIIVCKNTGVDEIVKAHNIGTVIEYGQEHIENSLIFAEKNREVLTEQGARANIIYNQEFSWEIMEKRLTDLYKQLDFPTSKQRNR